MADSNELYILNKVYEYLSENCVGPQNCHFIFKSMKESFSEIATFSYDYFISLFDNKEIITKSIIKEKIENFNNKKEIFLENKDNYPIAQKENNSCQYTKVNKQHYTNDQDLPDDAYYYCTKTQRFPKLNVLQEIKKLFETKDATSLEIKEIYAYLQKSFSINSFNMSNLKELLNSSQIVLLSFVNESILKYTIEEKDNCLLNIKAFFIKNSKVWLSCINNLGIDLIKNIVKNGIYNYVSFCQSYAEFDATFGQPIELINNNKSKLFGDDDSATILGFLNMFKEQELIELFSDPIQLSDMIEMYLEDEKVKRDKIRFAQNIKELLGNVNIDNKKAKIKYLFPYEIVPFFNKEGIHTLNELDNLDSSHFVNLYNYRQTITNYIRILQQSLSNYLNEKFKLLLQRVNASNIPNSLWEKYVEVLCCREQGKKLEETAKVFGMTREGIRQTEKKYLILFNDFYNSKNGSITRLIRSFCKNDYYLTINDVSSIFSFYPQLFIYFLKKIDINDLVYIDELNVFYFIDEVDWYKDILIFSEKLEQIVPVEVMNAKIKECNEYINSLGLDIPYDFCEKILLQDYKLNGSLYSRNRMSLASKYKQVLQSYFQEGINIYDQEDLAKFRKYYKEIFNDNEIPENDRALYGRITACCFLAGKGFYKLKQDHYLTSELADKIYQYIIDSPREIFLTNTIFACFEDELRNEGIKNKYYLQGVMREMYGDKLFFSRDYISKTKEKSSIYSEIYDFIKQTGREVSWDEIKSEFIGVTDIVFNIALSNENIIKLRKAYIHADNVKFEKEDVELLNKIVEKMVSDEQIHSSNDLLMYLNMKEKLLITKYGIDTQFKLFSYIAYLLQGKYEFQRPFFAKINTKIGSQGERINAFLEEYDEISIEEFFDFIYENKLHLYSISEYINANDQYIFKDKDTIILTAKTGLTKYNTQIAETVVLNAMGQDDFIVASKFNAYNFLPKEVKWTDWLLYSAFNKFSKNIKVLTTNNQMRFSTPIFVKADIAVNSYEELLNYIKTKLNGDELILQKYLRNKGLLD